MNNLGARTVVALVSALAVACARAPGTVGELTRCEEGSWSAPFPLHRGDGRPVYVERGIVTAFGSRTLALGTPTFLWLRQNHMLPGPGADRADVGTAFTRAGVSIDSAGVASPVPPVDSVRTRQAPRLIHGEPGRITVAWESFHAPGELTDPTGIDVASFDGTRWSGVSTILRAGRRTSLAMPAALRPGRQQSPRTVVAVSNDTAAHYLQVARDRGGRWTTASWRDPRTFYLYFATGLATGDEISVVISRTTRRPFGSLVEALHGQWSGDSIVWAPPVRLDTIHGSHDRLAMARLGGDSLLVIWHDKASTRLSSAVSLDAGRTWRATSPLALSSALDGTTLVVDASGSVHALFSGAPANQAAVLGAPGMIMHSRWRSGVWTTPVAVSSRNGLGAAAGVAPHGGVMAIWAEAVAEPLGGSMPKSFASVWTPRCS